MPGGTTWSGVDNSDREALQTYNDMKNDCDEGNLVGQLKVAAIDAYMATHKGGYWASSKRLTGGDFVSSTGNYAGIFPNGSYTRDHAIGDDFIYVRPRLSRRNTGGAGGEAYHAKPSDNAYSGDLIIHSVEVLERRPGKDLDFAGIFRDIDSVMSNWWDLPETGRGTGGDFGPATEIADTLADIAYDLGVKDGLLGNSGYIDVALGDGGGPGSLLWFANSEGFKTDAFRTWFEVFVARLPDAIGGCAKIVAWLATVTAAQARAWHITKADVTNAVERARDNFNVVAEAGDGLSPTEARFMKAAVLIAKNFLPKPASTVYDAFEVQSFLDEQIDGMTAAPGRDYESVMRQFKESMTKIEHQVSNSEEAIGRTAVSLLGKVRDHRDSTFNLCKNRVGESARISIPEGGQIDIHYDPVKSVTGILANIVGILNGCVDTISRHEEEMRTVFRRGHGIGMSAFGPGWAVQELAEMARENLHNIAWRCEASIEAIWAVFWMMIQKNEELGRDFLRANPALYYEQLAHYTDPEAVFNVHNARLSAAPPDEPFDYVIKDLEKRMGLEDE